MLLLPLPLPAPLLVARDSSVFLGDFPAEIFVGVVVLNSKRIDG